MPSSCPGNKPTQLSRALSNIDLIVARVSALRRSRSDEEHSDRDTAGANRIDNVPDEIRHAPRGQTTCPPSTATGTRCAPVSIASANEPRRKRPSLPSYERVPSGNNTRDNPSLCMRVPADRIVSTVLDARLRSINTWPAVRMATASKGTLVSSDLATNRRDTGSTDIRAHMSKKD